MHYLRQAIVDTLPTKEMQEWMQYLARLMRCWLLDRWQRSTGDDIRFCQVVVPMCLAEAAFPSQSPLPPIAK